MVRGKKASSVDGQKKQAKPQPPVKSFSPRVHTKGVATARAKSKTMPLRTLRDSAAKKPVRFNHNWKLGLYGEDTVFFMPEDLHALSGIIDERSNELRKLNHETNVIFRQGVVNLAEDSGLQGIENQKKILENLIEQLLQMKKRAFELAPAMVNNLQVFVEETTGCAADLIKRLNYEIVLLSPENAKVSIPENTILLFGKLFGKIFNKIIGKLFWRLAF